MENESNGKRIQLLTTFIINILAIGTGASFGISNVLISELKDTFQNNSLEEVNETSPFHSSIRQEDIFSFKINVQESTWIATFGMIGQYFPILFVGPLVGKFGKRISMQIDCVLFLIGFLLMGLAIDVKMLYASKFILGYGYLTSRSSIQPFTAEIVDPSIRGLAAGLWSFSFTLGQASSIFLAGILGWREISGFFAALSAVCFISLIWPHETPEWLMVKEKFKKATRSYEFYRSDKQIIVEDSTKRLSEDGKEKTYHELVKLIKEEKEDASKLKSPSDTDLKASTFLSRVSDKKAFIIKLLKNPEVYQPFGFLVVTFGLLELSGFAVLANFSIVLVETYGYGEETFVDAATLITIISLTRIPLTILSAPVLQKYRKRPTYFLACTALLIILAGIISFTTLVETGYLTQEKIKSSYLLQAVPFTLFILFYAGFSFGYGNIPFALMGELFPPNISNLANTAIFVIVNSVELTTVYTALIIKERYGLQYVFVIPAVAILLSAVWAAILMPETHGLSLKQIRSIYSRKSGSNDQNSRAKTKIIGLPPEETGKNHLKNTVRKASMTLWSVDVCVTSMKIVDGKNRFKPFKEMLHAMKAIFNQKENASLATVIEKDENQTAIGIHEDRFSNNDSKNNFKFQNENLPLPEDLKRSV